MDSYMEEALKISASKSLRSEFYSKRPVQRVNGKKCVYLRNHEVCRESIQISVMLLFA